MASETRSWAPSKHLWPALPHELADCLEDARSQRHAGARQEIVVPVEWAMLGELTHAQLCRADGSWIDLEARRPVS